MDVPAYDIFHTCSTRCIHSGVEHFGFFLLFGKKSVNSQSGFSLDCLGLGNPNIFCCYIFFAASPHSTTHTIVVVKVDILLCMYVL